MNAAELVPGASAAHGAVILIAGLGLDPRPCELCGLTIDRHDMVDDGDGPVHFCPDLSPDEMTLPELERRAVLRRQEEIAAILARMDAMEGPSDPAPPRAPEPYRPPASTIDAFWYVASLREPERLKAWLLDRPQDAPTLLKLMETC
jgi:hypothetical protein